jgi:predicted Zn-dependent protease
LQAWLSALQRRFATSRDQLRALLTTPDLRPDLQLMGRNLLATVYGELGQMAEAEAGVQPLLQSAEEKAVAQASLAHLYLEQDKEPDRAQALIREALKAYPNEPAYRSVLGWALVRCKHPEEGLKILEEVAPHEALVNDPAFLEHLGDVYRHVNRPEKARACWRKPLAAFPRTTEPGDRRKAAIERKLRETEE